MKFAYAVNEACKCCFETWLVYTFQTKEPPKVIQGANTPPPVLLDAHDFMKMHNGGGFMRPEGSGGVLRTEGYGAWPKRKKYNEVAHALCKAFTRSSSLNVPSAWRCMLIEHLKYKYTHEITSETHPPKVNNLAGST